MLFRCAERHRAALGDRWARDWLFSFSAPAKVIIWIQGVDNHSGWYKKMHVYYKAAGPSPRTICKTYKHLWKRRNWRVIKQNNLSLSGRLSRRSSLFELEGGLAFLQGLSPSCFQQEAWVNICFLSLLSGYILTSHSLIPPSTTGFLSWTVLRGRFQIWACALREIGLVGLRQVSLGPAQPTRVLWMMLIQSHCQNKTNLGLPIAFGILFKYHYQETLGEVGLWIGVGHGCFQIPAFLQF